MSQLIQPQDISETVEITVPPKRVDGERIDKYLAKAISNISRSRLQQLIDADLVHVNEQTVKASYQITPGDHIHVAIPRPPRLEVEPEPIPLDILYEDDYLLAINKQAGLVVHPGVGNRSGTLVNGLLYHTDSLAETEDEIRPGLVHRLDKDTSGIVLAAKDEDTLRKLSAQFENRVVEKEYRAWVWGSFTEPNGTIRKAIGRHPRDRKTFAPQPTGKRAVTHYEVLEDHQFLTFLRLKIETGRTHQIRVHCKSIDHPVVGDPTYSGRTKRLKSLSARDKKWGVKVLEVMKRQALHAYKIGFNHPWEKKWMELEAPFPADFRELQRLMQTRITEIATQ